MGITGRKGSKKGVSRRGSKKGLSRRGSKKGLPILRQGFREGTKKQKHSSSESTNPVVLGVVLPHLSCEIFRGAFSRFLSIFPPLA